MKITILIFITCICFAWADKPQKEESYKDLWLRGTMAEKRLFVNGIATGLSLFKNYTVSEAKSFKGDSVFKDSACASACQAFVEGMYRQLSYLDSGFTEENVIRAMDVLYGKETNKNISFQHMYMIALKEVRRLKTDKKRKSK